MRGAVRRDSDSCSVTHDKVDTSKASNPIQSCPKCKTLAHAIQIVALAAPREADAHKSNMRPNDLAQSFREEPGHRGKRQMKSPTNIRIMYLYIPCISRAQIIAPNFMTRSHSRSADDNGLLATLDEIECRHMTRSEETLGHLRVCERKNAHNFPISTQK